MIEALQLEFVRNALFAGLLASVVCGVIGTFVVVNRIVFISGGIAHAAYGGIGLAFYFGWPYLAGTLGFSLGAAIIMADHGNSEKMWDYEKNQPHTAHTVGDVPMIVFGENLKTSKLRQGGRLADIAPTLLAMMDLPKPEEMTGQSLIEK